MKIMIISFIRSCAHTAALSATNPFVGHCGHMPLLIHASTRDSWIFTGKSGSVFCGVTAPFSWVLNAHKFLFVPSKSLFPSPV